MGLLNLINKELSESNKKQKEREFKSRQSIVMIGWFWIVSNRFKLTEVEGRGETVKLVWLTEEILFDVNSEFFLLQDNLTEKG